jgi:hypothetical protein
VITDRDFLRAEAQYLTPPEDRDPVCDHCGDVELLDLDNADASVTDALGCASDAALCPRCRDIGAADAAKIAAEAAARVESFAVRSASMALGELSMRWRMRSGRGPSRAHHNAVETARAEASTGVATRAQGWVAL